MSERDRNQPPDEGAEQFAAPAQPVRPAASTYQTHVASDTSRDWQGTTGATDFLGLDGDLRLDPDATLAPMEGFPGLSNSSEGPVIDSWLMEIEGNADAPAAQAQGLDETTSADGSFDETDTDEAPAQAAPAPRRTLQLAVLVAVVALVGGGGWWWQQQRNAHTSTPVEVATRPAPKSTPKPKIPAPTHATDPAVNTDKTTEPVPAPTNVVQADPEPANSEPTPPTNGTQPTITMPDPGSASGSKDPSTVSTIDPSTNASNPDVAPPSLKITFPPPTLPPGARVEPPTPAPAVATPRTTVDPKGRLLPGTVRRATEADFADLWRETRIPTEMFQGERRLRTLNVGRVRALVIGGEYFEGTLYAVGQNRIWLDLELGRISFEASTVRELTQLPALAKGTDAKKKKVDELAALPHVEVRLPGGSLTGRLVGQDGRHITLITDDGLRTVVESDDIRPVTARNTRVVGTVRELDAKPH